MALVALFPLLALVHVVLLVAAVAVGVDFLGIGTQRMAGFAGEIAVRAVAREIGVGGMIERSRRPSTKAAMPCWAAATKYASIPASRFHRCSKIYPSSSSQLISEWPSK